MSITYPDWSPEPDTQQRAGIGALLYARGIQQEKSLRERLPSIAVSGIAHGAIAYVIIFAGLTVMKPQEEVQTITVSIAASQVAQPEPPPPPKVQMPNVAQPTVPQIAPPQLEIAAPPSQMAIQAAPPSPPVQQQTEKQAEEAPVSPPRFDAAYLNNTLPPYPNMSRRLREVGTVMLRVRVSITGQPLEVLMVKSSGYARLDEVALPAVKKWKFQPAQRNGAAIEAWVLVPVEFTLGK